MNVIINIDLQKFSLNGIPYFKNFIPHVMGDNLRIINAYDSKFELTELSALSQYSVNGSTFATLSQLTNALIPVLFTRVNLGIGSAASPTTAGISKLYNDLLASNTDGSVHQKAIVDEFLLYLKKPIERTGYVMAFDRLAIYNDFSIATSASVITNNLVNAQKGIVQKMTIKTSSLNPFPAGWVLLGFVRYTPGALTNVYCEWISGSRVEYWLEKPTS